MNKHDGSTKTIFTRAAHLAVTASLASAMLPLGVQAASALDLDAMGTTTSYGWGSSLEASTYSNETSSLPAQFDMRDKGWVTPVKFQNPWGTCWSFAAVASAESSIRSELMQKGASQDLIDAYSDLSERHLAWFTYTPVQGGSQDGEGGHNVPLEEDGDEATKLDVNAVFNVGGFPAYSTSLYSAGIGPVFESQAPYKNDEGNIDYITYEGEKTPLQYSQNGTWSLSQALQFQQVAELEESYILPEPSAYEPGTAEWNAANDAMKEQLMAGRALSCAFSADQSQPNFVTDKGYMNPGNNATGTWAHYTYQDDAVDHAVTIVGWDDNYSAENFGNPDPETGEVDPATRPAGDGAWIVKNSWGSDDEFPNWYPGGWGTDEDGDGGGDGYFYMSYYDKSLCCVEALDFDTDGILGHADSYIVDSYNYMPTNAVQTTTASDSHLSSIKEANVFTAEHDQVVRTLTCETTLPDTTVTYEVYRMPEDWDGDWGKAQLVLTKQMDEAYEFGGFHRVELSKDEQVNVREGQKYAVVVTKLCNDYNGTSTEYFSYALACNEKYRDEVSYPAYLQAAIAAEAEGLMAQDPNLSEEDAYAQAEDYWMNERTQAERDALDPVYSKGVVNEGESYLCADGEWSDFKELADRVSVNEDGQVDADNLAIKAYAEIADFATTDSLKQLEDNVKTARNLLQQTSVSADGSDVDPSAKWVDSAVHDAFEAAIAKAEEALGGDWVSQGTIDDATAALADAQATFEVAMKPGTKTSGGGSQGGGSETPGEDTKKPAADKTPAGKKNLPSTGDASLLAGIAAVLGGGGLAGAGAFIRRRRR